MNLGFDQPLYILPFDHRGSFQTKMFGWTGKLTIDQTAADCRRQTGDLRRFQDGRRDSSAKGEGRDSGG